LFVVPLCVNKIGFGVNNLTFVFALDLDYRNGKLLLMKRSSFFLCVALLSAVLLSCIVPVRSYEVSAEETEPNLYENFEALQSGILQTGFLAQEIQLVEGTMTFPTAIDIQRDIYIEALGAPAMFVLDNDADYIQNPRVSNNVALELNNDVYRHFVMWPGDGKDEIRVTFKNIIFRSTDGIGGLTIPNGGVNLTLENCTFERLGDINSAYGGAINAWTWSAAYYGEERAFTIKVTDCVFTSNKSLIAGAGFFVMGNPDEPGFSERQARTSVIFSDCTFTDNDGVRGSVFFSGGTIEWVTTPKPFPAWMKVLLAVFSFSLISGTVLVAYIFLQRRKLALSTVSTEDSKTSTVIVPIGDENIDQLCKEYKLTAREKEIVANLVEGKSQNTIARDLFVSLATVKTHTQNIYGKLNINSRFELISKLNQIR
jgi:DNA-binding CsgD family transcriptional regulator